MKNQFLNLFVLFLIFSTPLSAQWIDKGEYNELKLTNYPIKQLLTPTEKDYILCVDSNNTMFTIDYNGNILNSTNLKRDSLSFISLSSDGRTINYLKDTIVKIEDIYVTHFIYWICFNLDNSISFEKYLGTSIAYVDETYSQPEYLLNFFSNSKTGLISQNYYQYSWSVIITAIKFGEHSVYDFVKDSITIKYGGYGNKIVNDADNPIIVMLLEYKEENKNIKTNAYDFIESHWLQWTDDLLKTPFKTISRSNIDSRNPNNNISAYMPNNIAMTGQFDLIITSLDSVFKVFTKISDSFQLSDSFTLVYKPENYFLSENERFLIITGSFPIIDVLSLKTKSIIKKYYLADSVKPSTITIPKHRNGFFVGNDRGVIKYFNKDSILTSIELNDDYLKTNNDNLIISPNPAADYIEISCPVGAQHALPEQIRIYNVFGELVNNPLTPFDKGELGSSSSQYSIHNSQLRVDVSTLVPGVYFVRVGEKVGKFVKY